MDKTFLKKVEVVKDLNSDELDLFASKLQKETFSKDDIIIQEEEVSDKMYILFSGKVVISKRISMIDQQAKIDKTFITLKAKDHVFFGAIGLLGLQKRTATCCAKTDCEVYSLNHKDFMDLCDKNPPIGYKLLLEISRQLSEMIVKTNEDVLKLTTALIYALKN